MPLYESSQSFLEQAHLLISARPSTTRITTKYNLPHARKSGVTKSTSAPKPQQAKLTLKCYDPVSGTCLKYQTDKGAEVGRLIAALEGCGTRMVGLTPQSAELDVTAAIETPAAQKLPIRSAPESTAPAGKGKKKKGKR